MHTDFPDFYLTTDTRLRGYKSLAEKQKGLAGESPPALSSQPSSRKGTPIT